MNLLEFSNYLFSKKVFPGSIVIDATCGNGKDIVRLAKLLRGKGSLVSYDIQLQALEKAKKTIKDYLTEEERRVIIFKHKSHEDLDEENVDLIVYNLGYLPGGDKNITTQFESTLNSLKKALKSLSVKGGVIMTCYLGHEEGKKEAGHIINFLKTLEPTTWIVSRYCFVNQKESPVLFWITHRLHEGLSKTSR